MKTVVNAANSIPTGVNQTPNSNNNNNSASIVVPSITITPKVESEPELKFTSPSSSSSASSSSVASKRPASLDLNKPKKQRLVAPTPLVLESPDLAANMKTINTPDLENLLIASNLMATPQPGAIFPPKVGAVTSEQEAFGKGFDEALHSLYNSNKNVQAQQVAATSANSSSTSVSNTSNNSSNNSVISNTITSTSVQAAATNATGTIMSGGSFTYTNLETNFPIKDEPQSAPSPAPVSPIDMETQEKIKLERKRQRNRVAASKCRKRKLERISKLEDKVKQLKGENTDLGQVVKTLKDHVAQLKQQVIEHMNIGCHIPIYQNK